MSDVRVRFAPSPTGSFHIGSARTALFNWLYARHMDGVFVLRVEDTDKERNTPEALEHLKHGLKWLGMDWDEGPDVGGDYGPYFQSERGHIYQEYLKKLQDKGLVYEQEGATWLKISGEEQIIHDLVRGEVRRREEKDFVIFRSNGTPVFHFVNVVDDITMKITHVIRGEDHLSNTSKHLELFKAFEAPEPVFAHIPLILKQNGPGKMSKRDEGALIEDYEKKHYLPQAVRNYLCLLGWSPKDDREILSIEEIISLFNLTGINKNNAKFDEQKMAHINTEYVRALEIGNVAWLAKPVLVQAGTVPEDVDEDYLQNVLSIAQEKIRSIEDLPGFLAYFFKDDFPINEKAKEKIFKKGSPKEHLEAIYNALSSIEDFNEETVEAAMVSLCEQKGTKIGQYMQPCRVALSGEAMGPVFYPMLRVLGKNRVLSRIRSFIDIHC